MTIRINSREQNFTAQFTSKQISQIKSNTVQQILTCTLKVGFMFTKDILNGGQFTVNGNVKAVDRCVGDYLNIQGEANIIFQEINDGIADNAQGRFNAETLQYQDKIRLVNDDFTIICNDYKLSKILGMDQNVQYQGNVTFPRKMSYLGIQQINIMCDNVLQSTFYDNIYGKKNVVLSFQPSFQAGQFSVVSDPSQTFKVSIIQVQAGLTFTWLDENFKDMQICQPGETLYFEFTFQDDPEQIQNQQQNAQQLESIQQQLANNEQQQAAQIEKQKQDNFQQYQISLLQKIAHVHIQKNVTHSDIVQPGQVQQGEVE